MLASWWWGREAVLAGRGRAGIWLEEPNLGSKGSKWILAAKTLVGSYPPFFSPTPFLSMDTLAIYLAVRPIGGLEAFSEVSKFFVLSLVGLLVIFPPPQGHVPWWFP